MPSPLFRNELSWLVHLGMAIVGVAIDGINGRARAYDIPLHVIDDDRQAVVIHIHRPPDGPERPYSDRAY